MLPKKIAIVVIAIVNVLFMYHYASVMLFLPIIFQQFVEIRTIPLTGIVQGGTSGIAKNSINSL